MSEGPEGSDYMDEQGGAPSEDMPTKDQVEGLDSAHRADERAAAAEVAAETGAPAAPAAATRSSRPRAVVSEPGAEER